MESLTKENFWNELEEKYPAGMKIFCDWIDQYKETIGWSFLFKEANDLKFHDMPIAFQLGIWIQFRSEMTGIYPPVIDRRKNEIREFIQNLHEEATD